MPIDSPYLRKINYLTYLNFVTYISGVKKTTAWACIVEKNQKHIYSLKKHDTVQSLTYTHPHAANSYQTVMYITWVTNKTR